MKNFKLNLKGLCRSSHSFYARTLQPRDNREMSERRPSEERTLLAPITKSFARYAAMLIMLLTLGFGQAWGDEAIAYSGGFIYFDNSLGISDNTLQICARQSGWTGVSSLSNITNTKLYYVANPEGSGWGGILGWVVISANPAKSASNFDDWSEYTWCSDWNTYGFNSGSTYLIVPSSTSKSQSVTTTYFSGGYSALNSTQTINTVVKTGSGSYTAANSKATISITSYEMTGNGTVTKRTPSLETSAKTQTVSAARTATTTFTVGDVATGYQFDGWYTDATGGTQLSSSETYTYYPTAATTVYARFSEKMSTVTLTASPSEKGSFTIGDAAATSTTAGVTTTRSVTAVPISGYHFVSWDITGDASISSMTTNPTTVTGGGAGTAATLTATFAADAVNSLTVSKGTGISTVSGSTSPVTLGSKYAISATPETGYTFSGWTASPVANGTFDNASSASTNVTVKNGSVVVTASASERMSSLTTSCHYDAGNPSYADPTKSVSSIGISTTANLSATAPSTGYTFVGWTLTHCVRTSGEANSRNITIRSDGSGEAASAVANYEEDRSSRWHLVGKNETSKVTYPDGWNVTNTSMMQKATGHSTESVVYANVTVSNADGTYEFKVVDDNGASDDIWYGYSTGETFLTWTETSTKNVYTGDGNGNNLKFTPTVSGTYVFKVDYSGTYPAVTITYPVSYTLTYSIGSVAGTDGSISTSPITASGSLVLSGSTVTLTAPAAKTGYSWNGWYTNAAGTGEKIPDTDRAITVTMNADKTLYACYKQDDYTITLNGNGGTGHTASVTAHYDEYAPDDDGEGGHKFSITNPERSGYTFAGWYTNSDGTGTMLISPDGYLTWNIDGFTDASGKWIATTGTNLYARWKTDASVNAYNFQYGSGTYYSSSWTLLNFGAADANNMRTVDWTLINPASQKFYVGYNGDYQSTSINGGGKSSEGNLSDLRLAPGSLAVGTATGAVGKLVIFDNSTADNLYVGFQPNGYGLTYAGGTKAFSEVSDNMWQTDIVTLTAADVEGTFKVGLATATAGTYVDCSTMTTTDNAAALNTRKNALVSEQSYPAIPNLAAGQEGRFVIWDNDSHTGQQWYLSFLPVYSITYNANGADTGTAPTDANKYRTNETPTVLDNSGNLAKTGYAFSGWNTKADGSGTAYAAGAPLAAIGSNVTLYAQFEKAEITGISLVPGTVASGGTVTATPTIEPTPTGTTKICWKLLYNNGTEYSPQPTFTPGVGNAVSFPAPTASGTYKVQAQLRTGSECGAGTLLSERVASFVVAGTHTVTIQYKCGDQVIKTATTVEGVKPLEWSEETIGPGAEPFGYTFDHWEAGDGVTISIDGTDAIEGTTTTEADIYIKAIYDGRLTAIYTQKQMIYFKNTLGWSSVYVNFYTGDYWNEANGSGNNGVTNRNKAMIQIDDTNIWYYDFGTDGITPTRYVSFTEDEQEDGDHGYENFWKAGTGENVVYPARRADDLADKAGAIGFYAATPMFVPLAGQTPVVRNNVSSGQANYYNSGYWTKYTSGTGYTLEVYYDSDSSEKIKDIAFNSANELMPLAAVANLEASTTYRFQIKRAGDVYYGNAGTMTYANHGQSVAWEMSNEATRRNDANTEYVFAMCKITTTAAGDYTFNLSYSGDNSNPVQYRLRMEVDYPIADGDYRVIYKDNEHTAFKPSAIVTKAANHKDTVSFFIRPESGPVMKIQQSSVTNEGAITWNDLSDISSAITDARCPKDSVYNICLTMNESGAISVENIEGYNGYFYIRTDAANSRWDNYRAADHQMTYSEYAAKKTGSDYTHYWMAHVYANANVKFVIANDYSPCISDTLIRQTARGGDGSHVNESGDILAEANIRYMWDMRNNAVMRAYLAPAQTDGSKFLVLQGQATELLAPDGTALTGDSDDPGNNHGGGANAIQFTDKENWMYDAEVQAVPGGRVKLYAVFHESTFYYYGDDDDSFDDPHAIDLIGGSGDAQNIRVVYDFKTDRLIAAWVPSDGDISIKQTINADIMLIREHQNAGKQINLVGTGSISTDKTVYGVMRFNRWTLNNKSTESGHAVLPVGEQKSQYERFNYFISFPFDVKVGEIFGFGTIGRHYRIFYYDGLGRAQQGFFAERGDDNWRMIDDTDSILHANQGYLLQLNYIRMADDNTETWPQASMNEVELYFPAMGNINTISLDDVTIPALGVNYQCTIDLRAAHGGNTDADRRIKDSYWRCIGVPGFTSHKATADTWENFDWKTEAADMPYLYEWHMNDNKLSVVSSSTFTFLPMHAYLIQNGKSFTWTSVAVPSASSVVARRQAPASEDSYYEFYLEMQNGEKALDHTYVRLTDNENVTADFDFGQDLSKELNSGANIYTQVGYERLAANNLPMSEQTTVVPVGVKITEEGYYTFAMPEGSNGVGVTLIDNERGERTSLSAFDYTVNLEAGNYDNRFALEISPIKHIPTEIGNIDGEDGNNAAARKLIIDGVLYIVKDGKMFDARGNKVN